jgi:transketolase
VTNRLGYDETDTLIANTLRFLAADAVQAANSGHPGLPLGAADVMTVLWTRFLKHNPADPRWFNRDRFVLSAGHGSAMLYGLLHLAGYPLSLDELKRFRQWGSLTPGHPEYEPDLGIETTTGPLGQGLATAVGMALAERMLAARFDRPDFELIDHHTFVLASDGDLMEGVSHEVASLAGHLGLGKLIVLYDDNHISIDGPTDLTYSDDALARFAAYGWKTQRVDGHDMGAVDAALRAAQEDQTHPTLIACRTHIGYGSPGQDTAKVHGTPLGEEALRQTKEKLGWPADAHFLIPDAVRERLAERQKVGADQQAAWEKRLAAYLETYPEMAALWDLLQGDGLPAGWDAALPTYSPEDKPLATRAASGQVLDAIAPRLPFLVGGSADLTPSNKTRPSSAQDIRPADFSGSYIRFGVREHAMGAILNGLALHGLRPYGGTFLVFSDYMRPAIRLAAMMRLPVIYVFTHDSIGVGEDGPTHQPTEQIAALRAIPGLTVIRPADGNETSAAWRQALRDRDGPTALILTRQGVPQVAPHPAPVDQGAYTLAEAAAPDVVLIATGSEVHLALAARDLLAQEEIAVTVVSMPSWELFDRQPRTYQDAVLPPGVPRVAVEAGVTTAWGHYVGPAGAVVGLDRFGASGPYKTVYQGFGITPEAIAERAKGLLGL